MSQVWIPSKVLSWELAEVVSYNEDRQEYIVLRQSTPPSEVTLNIRDVYRTDPSHFQDFDDLCSMNLLSEGPLLNCLRNRFNNDKASIDSY